MGLAKTVGKKIAEKATEGALESVAKKAPRMSEALNPHVGKRLYITQADRTALDYPEGLLGGPGYVELAGIDPKYKDIAWAVQSPGVAKTMVGSMARNPEEAIWANLIGSPEQHRSNKVVFDKIMNKFYKAVEEDKLTPELHKTINKRLADMRDKKTGKAFFPEDVDVLSPEFINHTNTFHQRASIADILAGKGVGGQKGTIIDYPQIIKETTDPLLLEAQTGDIGDRLFSLSGNIEERPDLHPAFHYSLSGRKESEAFKPAPQKIILEDYYKDFQNKLIENKKPVRLPTYYDLTRGYAPNVKITDEMLERMYKEGYAGGGAIKSIAKRSAKRIEEILKNAEKGIPPPAEKAADTAITGTIPTYQKAKAILESEGVKGKDIIDFGAGRGLGSTIMKSDSYEPFVEGWEPTFVRATDIPDEAYKGLTNFSVLNVVPRESRDEIVKNIGRVMQPEGVGLITARDPSLLKSTLGIRMPEENAIVTSTGNYQKGFSQRELEDYLKYMLGSDFEYEPLKELSGSALKIRKKAEGGSIDEPEVLKEEPRKRISGTIADILKPASEFLEKYEVKDYVPLLGGTDLAELTGVKGVQTLADEMSRGYRPIRNLERGKLQSSYFDPRLTDVVDLGTTALGGAGVAKKLGKAGAKEIARQVETGTGIIGRNVINPRMNIIKDPGGMVVGGEKTLDTELIAMKKNEALDVDMTGANTLPEMFARREVAPKDPNAVALNQWIDTKVRKYIRNQAGTEADPILKAIESGVEHKFSPAIGDTKYYVRHKRELVGKPVEGIAKTDLGKEWEYKVDSTFTPKKSADIKEILNMPMEHLDSPAVRDRRRASMLRVEQDLPIHNEQDLEALKLINQIPDENVYTIDVSSLTNRLGLNHVSDVLYEDLQTGRLRPEQLNQMSIEKAIRRTAEYDAQKAREMEKAHATSIEGMPIPKQYDDGFKWVELKHKDVSRTKEALKSEGEMMGHCVGSYCSPVMSGEIKIYSLRSPDGKSHVTIEARPQYSASEWYRANADLINSDPYLKEIEPNIASGDIDAKYGNNPSTDADYVRMMEKEMRKKGIEPIEPQGVLSLHQVKGKQNKRPDEKYQKYISDFIKNNPTKHEIDDVKELDNTNLMSTQDIYDTGLVPKEVYLHPDVDRAVKKRMAMYGYDKDADNLTPLGISDQKEMLFKEIAQDFGKKNIFFVDKDDILNYLKEKYLLPKKKSGGPINLNQEYKLENMRRRYG